MSVRVIQDRLNSYGCASAVEEEQALREITQEIVLAALGRTSFFDKAAFQGGTCLRIFHGVNRFSEDLDFALKLPDGSFELGGYLNAVLEDVGAFGYRIEIDDRSGVDEVVKKAFLKDDSIGRLLTFGFRPKTGPLRKIRIKFEVDSNPPAGHVRQVKQAVARCRRSSCVFDDRNSSSAEGHCGSLYFRSRCGPEKPEPAKGWRGSRQESR